MRRRHRQAGLVGAGVLVLVLVVGCTGLWTTFEAPKASVKGIGAGEWVEDAGNPVFGQGIGGSKAYYPCVLYDGDLFSGHGRAAAYKMWYGTSGSQTGLATSDDGISWQDLGVVLSAGYHTTVKYDRVGFPGSGPDSTDTMYYRAWYWNPSVLYSVSALGYAESPDGVNWTNIQSCKNGAVPIVLDTTGAWNRGSYGPCDVLVDPGASNTGTDWAFTLYYDGTTGGTEAIGLGFSSDGITWTGYDSDGDGKADPVLLGTYATGTWDYNYVSRATVLETEDGYAMWYSGGQGSMDQGIGYATSPDGIHWTRDPSNPLFHYSDGVAWRDKRTYGPSVLPANGGYVMWYAGVSLSSGDYSIGRATLAPPVIRVGIDIKPDSDPNSINLGAKGVLPVAVLGSPDLDVSTIDPTTVLFAGAAPVRWVVCDTNSDAIPDLLFHFEIQALNLTDESQEATLNGQTLDGVVIEGQDSVRIVPKGKK